MHAIQVYIDDNLDQQQLEELRSSVQMLENLLAQEREQLAQAEALKQEQSAELKERGEGIQRARKKVAQASNLREANAAEREVEANRRAIKEREEELSRIGDTIEAKTASLAEREKDFEEAKQVLQSQEESSKARIGELEEERGKLLDGRVRPSTEEGDLPTEGVPEKGRWAGRTECVEVRDRGVQRVRRREAP